MKYLAVYNGRKLEVSGNTSYEAYKSAVLAFKAPKSKHHMVMVVLAENTDGEPVIHSTASL
jgi:hypothetical protein